MNRKTVARPSVKAEVKAPNRPQEPIQTPPVPPAGDSITIKEFLAKMAARDAKAAESRVEVAERLEAHAQRESILASFCAAVGQPVPAEVTADALVKLQEKAAWDAKLPVEMLTRWLGSLLDAAGAQTTTAPSAATNRARVAQAKSVDLRTITAESNAAVRELFQVAGSIALYLGCVADAQARVNAQRKVVADLEAQLVAARAELEKANASRWHYNGAAEANGVLAQEIADALEGSAHWELLSDTPVGCFANLADLLAAQRRTENLNPAE